MKRICSALLALTPLGACASAPDDLSIAQPNDRASYLDSDGTDGAARGRRSWTTMHEPSAADVVKHHADASAAFVPASETESALREAAAAPADQLVSVSVRLREPDDAVLDLHDVADPARRADRVADYHARIAPLQDTFAARLAGLGGREINRHFLTNHVLVELPAGRVAELAALPDVAGVARNGDVARQGIPVPFPHPIYNPPNLPPDPTGYNGQDVRTAMHLSYPIAHGVTGAGTSIGIVDCDPIPPRHWNMQNRYTNWYCSAQRLRRDVVRHQRPPRPDESELSAGVAAERRVGADEPARL